MIVFTACSKDVMEPKLAPVERDRSAVVMNRLRLRYLSI